MYLFLENDNPKTMYLRTSPEMAWERLLQRGRPEEKNVTLEYLRKLGYFHDLEFCRPGQDFIIDESEFPLSVSEKTKSVENFVRLFQP